MSIKNKQGNDHGGQQESEQKLLKNLNSLETLFAESADVNFHTFSFGESLYKHDITFIMCIGLVDSNALNNVIYERFVYFFKHITKEKVSEQDVIHHLYAPGITRIYYENEAIEKIFSGQLLVYFQKENMFFTIDISDRPQRSTEETNTEVAIKGPRDNFIEDLSTNIALIRKRLRTNSLALKKYTVGKRTQTEVAILYIKDIANGEQLQELEKRIKEINIDGVFSGRQFHELILEKPFSFFPTHHYTGRPDFAINSLLNGRYLIFVDGVAYAVIVPVNFGFILKTGEDTESNYIYNSLERLIRFLGLVFAIYLPGFHIALTSFHQNQIPIVFLGTIIEASKGVPFPAPIEALVTLFLFEVFREAGLRLPMAIGQTLSVVGGLIIGDAAIRAGITSPLTVVIMATSAVAAYTLVNLSLHGIVAILRFFVLLLSSCFGFFGFFVSIYIVLMYMANIQSLGVSYMTVPEVTTIKPVLKTFLRLPEKKYKRRPSFLRTKDKTRQPPKRKD
ncbi:spore germination protein [Pueribacillus sp. YX66]|uniref:spore germination protein n=1 Tax=Pueribacillus sp. YX66 TaxID=3229242 RepID=UPI00358D913B